MISLRAGMVVWRVVLSVSLLLTSTDFARADQTTRMAGDQAIDITILTLADSGILPIPATELKALSPLLKCLTHGDKDALTCGKEAVYERILGKELAQAGPIVECIIGGRPVVSCATEAAVAQLPPELRSIMDCGSDVGKCVTGLAVAQLPDDVKPIAACLAAGKDAVECAGTAAVGQLPPDAQSAANCLLTKKDPKKCAEEEAISRLPPEARPVATCIANGGDPAKCAETEMVSRLPPEAKALTQCIQNGGDPIDCAARQAGGAQKAQFEAIKKMMDPTKVPIIIGLFKAIQEEDWAMVSALAGAQAAKIAACAVLEVFLIPGPHQKVLCDTAGEIVERRVQSVQTFIEQAKANDVGGMLGTLAKAGLIDQQCAFAHVISPEIEEVICGNLAKVIDAGANSPVVIGILTSMFTASPVLGVVVGLIFDALSGKDDDCGKPAEYFANNYLTCQHRDVYMGITNPQQLAKLSDDRNKACFNHFKRCLDDDDAGKLCAGLTTESNRQTQALITAYRLLAEGRARGAKSELEANRSNICAFTSADERFAEAKSSFIAGCSAMIGQVRPLKNFANSCSAGFDPSKGGVSFGGGPSAQEAACQNAAQSTLPTVISDVCVGAGICFPVKPPTDIIVR